MRSLACTPAEAVLVRDAFLALDPALQAKIRARLNDPSAAACPFLEAGRCSVYESRPLVCRAYGFSAEPGNVYFGCEVLFPLLKNASDFRMPSFDEAKLTVPNEKVLDSTGRALPELGVLAEMLARFSIFDF